MVWPDQVSLGVLVNAVPRDLVDEAVAVCGVRERRQFFFNGATYVRNLDPFVCLDGICERCKRCC